MIFISVTDVSKLKAQTVTDGSYKWSGLLLGMGLSELLSSACLFVSIYLTYKIEQISDAYFIQNCKLIGNLVSWNSIEHYMKVSASDLNVEIDELANDLSLISADVVAFERL